MKYGTTPSQTIGPFFLDALGRRDWSDLTVGNPQGERIRIDGRVFDGDGAPVPDALIEIWQANAAGRYSHAAAGEDQAIDPSFAGFGRCPTDAEGGYRFSTIRPGRAADAAAPYINVSVFARGLLKRLVTRIYFADDASSKTDPLLAGLAPERRRSLLADRIEGEGRAHYRFNIVLQGDRETVFFDL